MEPCAACALELRPVRVTRGNERQQPLRYNVVHCFLLSAKALLTTLRRAALPPLGLIPLYKTRAINQPNISVYFFFLSLFSTSVVEGCFFIYFLLTNRPVFALLYNFTDFRFMLNIINPFHSK